MRMNHIMSALGRRDSIYLRPVLSVFGKASWLRLPCPRDIHFLCSFAVAGPQETYSQEEKS